MNQWENGNRKSEKPYAAYNLEAQALIVCRDQMEGNLYWSTFNYDRVTQIEELGLRWVVFGSGGIGIGKFLFQDCIRSVLEELDWYRQLFLIRGINHRFDFTFGRREQVVASAYLARESVPVKKLYQSAGFDEDAFRKSFYPRLP